MPTFLIQTVDQLAKALEGRVEVIACMVDRICVDRVIEQEAIKVTAEPYRGDLVVLHPPISDQPPPFAGEEVCLPSLESEANYLCRRKFLLVNGTHTTLAFMTLCMRQPGSSNEPGDWPLIDWDVKTCGEQYHKEIWAWAVARLLILLWEHEQDVLMHAHNVDTDEELCDVLLNYSTTTLKVTIQTNHGAIVSIAAIAGHTHVPIHVMSSTEVLEYQGHHCPCVERWCGESMGD